MGRSRYKICDETAPHFLTCTVLNWMPLFTRPQTSDIILEALRHRQEQDELGRVGTSLCPRGQQRLFPRGHIKRAHPTWLWEEGSHPQMIENEDVLRQKLEYIHQNPVKRGYVDEAEHWRYSSARNYAGLVGLMPVYREWL